MVKRYDVLAKHLVNINGNTFASDEEAIAICVPAAMPPASTSLRDYVDKSETLSKLVQLGNKTKAVLQHL